MTLSDYGKPVTITAPADAIRPDRLGLTCRLTALSGAWP